MLYKDFVAQGLECDSCPLHIEGLCNSGMSDHNGVHHDPPCVWFKDDTDLEEEVVRVYERMNKREAYAEKQYDAQQKRHAKNELAKKRRYATSRHVYQETQEIKRLKKKIGSIYSIYAMGSAFSFANSMMSGNSYKEDTSKRDAEVAEVEEEIARLEQVKKDKLKAFRKTEYYKSIK